MSKKIYYYNGKMSSFAFPVLMLLVLLGFVFFAFFGALAFLFLGALGIGAAFIRMIFPKKKQNKNLNKKRSSDVINLEKSEYKVYEDN